MSQTEPATIRGTLSQTPEGEQVYEVAPEDRADFHRAVREGRPVQFVEAGEIKRLVE